jgi:hypothetical protein
MGGIDCERIDGNGFLEAKKNAGDFGVGGLGVDDSLLSF